MKTKPDKRLNVARKMPMLNHSPFDDFDIDASGVANWLASQPEIKGYLFDLVVRKKIIVFDKATKCWKGTDSK